MVVTKVTVVVTKVTVVITMETFGDVVVTVQTIMSGSCRYSCCNILTIFQQYQILWV